METPPFGHFALSPWREKLRLLAGRSGRGGVERIVASLARRVSQMAHPDPFDMEIFKGQRVRLYPRTNLCEKRVYARPDSWDHEERSKITQIIKDHDAGRPLVFVDAGANVGLYSLFLLGEARAFGRAVEVLAIEPDPTNRDRLAFNINASDAAAFVRIIDKALGIDDKSGMLIFSGSNRGEIRLATGQELAQIDDMDMVSTSKVDIVSLNGLFVEEKIGHVDLLKIDIEGGEVDVLKAFFAQAEHRVFPHWIILETISTTGEEALQSCLNAGYEVDLQTSMNAVLKLQTKQDNRENS